MGIPSTLRLVHCLSRPVLLCKNTDKETGQHPENAPGDEGRPDRSDIDNAEEGVLPNDLDRDDSHHDRRGDCREGGSERRGVACQAF